MHKTEEMKAKLKSMEDLKECIINKTKSAVDGGLDAIDTKELGEAVDMIKDLAEARCKCWEALYYEHVCKAMEEAESDEMDRMGYNHNHYNSGRFAPSGRGHRVGFIPNNLMPYWDDAEMMMVDQGMNKRMGYSGQNMVPSVSGGQMSRGSNGYFTPDMMHQEYGRPYNAYQQSKRHYTETRSTADKEEMDRHATEHLSQTLMTVRDIWKDADPTMKKKMKADLTALVGEMNV